MKKASKKENGIASEATSTFKKSLTINSQWDDKDEFLDVIYWFRQVLAAITGVLWGLVAVQGILGIILFFAVNCGLVYLYFSKYQQIEEEDYGGPIEIIKEGLFTAFSVFLVAWITVYTAFYTTLS